jgi:hypothetical protein
MKTTQNPAGRSDPDAVPDPATVDPTSDPDGQGPPIEKPSTAPAAQPRDASGDGMLT